MTDIVVALADCLEILRAGEGDISACLEKYPDLADQLDPLLRTVEQIRPLPIDVTPPYDLRISLRKRLTGAEPQAGELTP